MIKLFLSTLLIWISVLPIKMEAAVFEEELPTLWEYAPSSLADYPMTKNCSDFHDPIVTQCSLIDPWNYLDRLGLYKILIATTSIYMPFCSSSNTSNILFGLPSQFSWQHDTNRLFSNGTIQISNQSWWASMNYFLSVIPFLAAVDAGIIQQGSFRLIQRENFCTNIDECKIQAPTAMNRWRLFFSNISQPNYCNTDDMNDKIIDHCYLAPMWSAHIASIQAGLPIAESKLSFLPSNQEKQFGLSWANLVSIVAMSRENTNLTNVYRYQQEFLPRRLLRSDDHPPHCTDLSQSVNRALELFFFVRLEWYPELEKIWKDVTCNYEARRDSQLVLQTVALSLPRAIEYFSAALVKSEIFECDY